MQAKRQYVGKSFSFESRISEDIKESSDSISTDDSSSPIGADLKGTTIHINKKCLSQGQKSATRNTISKENDTDTLDVTVETYKDLKHAQETLMRYANKMGMDMEDLLVNESSQAINKDRSKS
jgi:hypothetical protein